MDFILSAGAIKRVVSPPDILVATDQLEKLKAPSVDGSMRSAIIFPISMPINPRQNVGAWPSKVIVTPVVFTYTTAEFIGTRDQNSWQQPLNNPCAPSCRTVFIRQSKELEYKAG